MLCTKICQNLLIMFVDNILILRKTSTQQLEVILNLKLSMGTVFRVRSEVKENRISPCNFFSGMLNWRINTSSLKKWILDGCMYSPGPLPCLEEMKKETSEAPFRSWRSSLLDEKDKWLVESF